MFERGGERGELKFADDGLMCVCSVSFEKVDHEVDRVKRDGRESGHELRERSLKKVFESPGGLCE